MSPKREEGSLTIFEKLMLSGLAVSVGCFIYGMARQMWETPGVLGMVIAAGILLCLVLVTTWKQ